MMSGENCIIEKKSLFGIDITISEYNDFIHKSIDMKSGYSCFLNSHMIFEFYNYEGFSSVLKNASFVLADGMPVLYSLNYILNLKQCRIAGNDVIFSLLEVAQKKNLKVFLIGSTDDILNIISSRLFDYGVTHKTYSPPFLPIELFDFDYQANLINDFGADIVLVGLGCPKQEKWMFEMNSRVKASMYGVGGAFLLYAGVDSRAPKWMRDLSLEWAYRLASEPKRLFKRYFITNFFFIRVLIKELIFKGN